MSFISWVTQIRSHSSPPHSRLSSRIAFLFVSLVTPAQAVSPDSARELRRSPLIASSSSHDCACSECCSARSVSSFVGRWSCAPPCSCPTPTRLQHDGHASKLLRHTLLWVIRIPFKERQRYDVEELRAARRILTCVKLLCDRRAVQF